jgi:hypothetical protein
VQKAGRGRESKGERESKRNSRRMTKRGRLDKGWDGETVTKQEERPRGDRDRRETEDKKKTLRKRNTGEKQD